MPDPTAEPSRPHGDPLALDSGRLSPLHRGVALLEVILCSGYPTQVAIRTTLIALGYQPSVSGHLRLGFVAALSLLDSVAVIGLMAIFLSTRGERLRGLFLGRRAVSQEARFGVPLILVALAIGFGILAAIQEFAPLLHTVDRNPFGQLVQTPRDAWLFATVVIVAGGVREELQRAFLLHRFELWLGGPALGLVATSVAFGIGHLSQGADAAIAIGTLGAFWGIVYLRRRSVIAPMLSHSGFNLVQTIPFLLVGR